MLVRYNYKLFQLNAIPFGNGVSQRHATMPHRHRAKPAASRMTGSDRDLCRIPILSSGCESSWLERGDAGICHEIGPLHAHEDRSDIIGPELLVSEGSLLAWGGDELFQQKDQM